MQNLRSNEGMMNGSITSEHVEVAEEHAEAISFLGALCIPVSENFINWLYADLMRVNNINILDL